MPTANPAARAAAVRVRLVARDNVRKGGKLVVEPHSAEQIVALGVGRLSGGGLEGVRRWPGDAPGGQAAQRRVRCIHNPQGGMVVSEARGDMKEQLVGAGRKVAIFRHDPIDGIFHREASLVLLARGDPGGGTDHATWPPIRMAQDRAAIKEPADTAVAMDHPILNLGNRGVPIVIAGRIGIEGNPLVFPHLFGVVGVEARPPECAAIRAQRRRSRSGHRAPGRCSSHPWCSRSPTRPRRQRRSPGRSVARPH